MTSPSAFVRVCLCGFAATTIAAIPSAVLADATGAIVPALSGELGVAHDDAVAFAWQIRAGMGGRSPFGGAARTNWSWGALAGLMGNGNGVSAALLGRITLADRMRFALVFGEAGPYTRLSGPSSTGAFAALTVGNWLGPQLSVWAEYGTGDVHVVGVTAGLDVLRAAFTLGQMMFPD